MRLPQIKKAWNVDDEIECMLGVCHLYSISFKDLMELPIPTYLCLRNHYSKYCEQVEKERQKNKVKNGK